MVDPAELKPVEDVLNSKYDNGGYKGLQGMGKDAFYSTQCRGGGGDTLNGENHAGGRRQYNNRSPLPVDISASGRQPYSTSCADAFFISMG